MKNLAYILIGILIVIAAGVFIYNFYIVSIDDVSVAYTSPRLFDSDSLFLKVGLREDGESIQSVRIRNVFDQEQSLVVSVLDLEDIVKPDLDMLILAPQEEKTVSLLLSASNASLGVHTGALVFTRGSESDQIPIILEIQSDDVIFDSNSNLFPRGADIVQGQNLQVELRIFDLGSVGRSVVDARYYIKDFHGNVIVSESENIVIDGQLDKSKTFALSKDIPYGAYVFITELEYVDSIGTSTVQFSVSDDSVKAPVGGFGDRGVFLVVVLVGSLFGLFLILFIASLFYRDKLMMDLHAQYMNELRKQRKLIQQEQTKVIATLKTQQERVVYTQEIQKVEKERTHALKKTFDDRVKRVTELRERGSKKSLQKQIELWKKKGYDTSVIEKSYAFPSATAIREKIRGWKKKGYDTHILE
jgi:hypothetical protein